MKSIKDVVREDGRYRLWKTITKIRSKYINGCIKLATYKS